MDWDKVSLTKRSFLYAESDFGRRCGPLFRQRGVHSPNWGGPYTASQLVDNKGWKCCDCCLSCEVENQTERPMKT